MSTYTHGSIIFSITDEDTNMQAYVYVAEKAFHVILKDLDSDMVVPEIPLYRFDVQNAEQLAIAKCKSILKYS